jgi:hypothetical protein
MTLSLTSLVLRHVCLHRMGDAPHNFLLTCRPPPTTGEAGCFTLIDSRAQPRAKNHRCGQRRADSPFTYFHQSAMIGRVLLYV